MHLCCDYFSLMILQTKLPLKGIFQFIWITRKCVLSTFPNAGNERQPFHLQEFITVTHPRFNNELKVQPDSPKMRKKRTEKEEILSVSFPRIEKEDLEVQIGVYWEIGL